MAVEEKWKANQAKVAFMKGFPGLTLSWAELEGKSIEAVIPLQSKPQSAVIVFSDGAFIIAPPLAPEPWELTDGLTAARRVLEAKHPDAYLELDQLVRADKEALRAARLEKIVGAIENNLELIPELKDRLRALVAGWK